MMFFWFQLNFLENLESYLKEIVHRMGGLEKSRS
jgi:hypothetical protein